MGRVVFAEPVDHVSGIISKKDKVYHTRRHGKDFIIGREENYQQTNRTPRQLWDAAAFRAAQALCRDMKQGVRGQHFSRYKQEWKQAHPFEEWLSEQHLPLPAAPSLPKSAVSVEAPTPGIYRHFKGNLYEVIDIASHSETQEPMVVYRVCYGEQKLWVRPVSMWFEHVDRDDYHGPRFVRVSN